jgi:hypothetical protein
VVVVGALALVSMFGEVRSAANYGLDIGLRDRHDALSNFGSAMKTAADSLPCW